MICVAKILFVSLVVSETFQLDGPCQYPIGATIIETHIIRWSDGRVKRKLDGQAELRFEFSGQRTRTIEYKIMSETLHRCKIKMEKTIEHSNFGGRWDSSTEDSVLLDKELLRELRDGRWTYRLANGDPTTEEESVLNGLSYAAEESHELENSVQVGDEWTLVIPANIQEAFAEFGGPVAKATVRFEKVRPSHRERIAELEIHVVSQDPDNRDDSEAKFDLSLRGNMSMGVQTRIVYLSNLKGRVRSQERIKENGIDGHGELEANISYSSSVAIQN